MMYHSPFSSSDSTPLPPSRIIRLRRGLLRGGLRLPAAAIAGMLLATSSCEPAAANGRYLIRQSTNSDCGPAALATLLTYYLDIPSTETEIARLANTGEYGTTLVGLEEAAAAKGAGAESFRMDFKTLKSQMYSYPAPVLVRLLLPQPHFVLLLDSDDRNVMLSDPASNNIVMTQKAFMKRWLIPGLNEGYVLIAAREDERTNVQRRNELIADLKQQQMMLTRPRPAPAMRRF